MNKLAIYAPNLGAISESFIKRHMAELLPNDTVIVAGSNQPPYNGHWNVDAPQFLLPELSPLLHLDLKAKIYKHGLNLISAKSNSNLYFNKSLEAFLVKNNVKTILGEYLDVSTTIIDLAHKLGIKLFAHAHGYDISIKLKEKFWRKEYLKLNKTAGIITMSNYSRQLLINIGIDENLIHVIPYGVNLPPAFTKASGSSAIKCLAVGRMIPKKAPLLLLDAFRRAAEVNPMLTLDYIGSGDLYNSALQYIKEHKLDSKVNLHGAIPNKDVVGYMNGADIFIQHSITCPDTGDEEGLPVAILEAMAHYLPVISTRHAGIPEAVIDSLSGYVVEEGDTTTMADKLLAVAKSKKMREDMGQAGREIVEKKFTWNTEKKSLLELMQLAQ